MFHALFFIRAYIWSWIFNRVGDVEAIYLVFCNSIRGGVCLPLKFKGSGNRCTDKM